MATMLIRLGLCSSKRIRIHATAGRVRKGAIPGGEATAAAVALVGADQYWRRPSSWTTPLRQLLWRLRSRWRHATSSRRGRGQFGYDPESYSQNFDDGCFPREHRPFSCSGAVSHF